MIGPAAGQPPGTSPRPTTARIAPRDPITSEIAELLASSPRNADGSYFNIMTTMAHHPELMARFSRLGGFLLRQGLVPAREREIVILRVGACCGSVYEFGQHTLMGRSVGLNEAEIAALAASTTGAGQATVDPGTPSEGWAEHELDLITMADELCTDNCVSDATFGRLRARWSEAELIELVLCAGFYRMVSGFLNSMGVQLDAGVPGWPAAGSGEAGSGEAGSGEAGP